MTGNAFTDPWFWGPVCLAIGAICGTVCYLLGMQRGQYDANRRWTKAGYHPEEKEESV